MNQALSFTQIADHEVEEFEGDLRRYKAANRRSVWVGLLLLAFATLAACTVCSAAVLMLR
jgi:hypothetical protein